MAKEVASFTDISHIVAQKSFLNAGFKKLGVYQNYYNSPRLLPSKRDVYYFKFKGTSKNSNFFVRAKKHRPESRSLRGVNEDSRTELMPLSRKKCIFRDALNT